MTPAGKILNSTVLLRSLKPVALKLQGPSESPRRYAKTQLVGPHFLLFPLLYPGCCTHSITRIQPITSAESPVSTGSSTLLSRPLMGPPSALSQFLQPNFLLQASPALCSDATRSSEPQWSYLSKGDDNCAAGDGPRIRDSGAVPDVGGTHQQSGHCLAVVGIASSQKMVPSPTA